MRFHASLSWQVTDCDSFDTIISDWRTQQDVIMSKPLKGKQDACPSQLPTVLIGELFIQMSQVFAWTKLVCRNALNK